MAGPTGRNSHRNLPCLNLSCLISRQLEQQIASEITAASDEAAIEAVRVSALGRNGSITALLKTLGG